MHFATTLVTVLLTALQPALAVPSPVALTPRDDTPWSVDFYSSGCPAGDEGGDQGSFGGHAGQELHCMTASWHTAHNIKLSGIEANGRKVILYHNTENFQTPTCSDQDIIATLSKDGCSVIPGDTSINAVSIVAA